MSDLKDEEMSDFETSETNKGKKGSLQSVEVWSDPCGVWLAAGLKPLRLPRAQASFGSLPLCRMIPKVR